MTAAEDALGFHCSQCGKCCRDLRVALTHRDLARLRRSFGRDARGFVDWLAPDAVDMTSEPSSFVELSVGRRLMVLAHADGACRFLGSDNRCSAYTSRPEDCRTFPFAFESETAPNVRRLTLLPLAGCESVAGPAHELETLRANDEQRWRALSEYQSFVLRWNRATRHRRRLGRGVGNAEAFLDFLERQLSPTEEDHDDVERAG